MSDFKIKKKIFVNYDHFFYPKYYKENSDIQIGFTPIEILFLW